MAVKFPKLKIRQLRRHGAKLLRWVDQIRGYWAENLLPSPAKPVRKAPAPDVVRKAPPPTLAPIAHVEEIPTAPAPAPVKAKAPAKPRAATKVMAKAPVKAMVKAVAKPAAKPRAPAAPKARLPVNHDFSPNPAKLTMHSFQPHHLPISAPIVVLMHGCGQDPASFATETGWRALALQHNFALLMPGQTEDNNRQRCFNWFRPEDFSPGSGESASIISMLEALLLANHGDRKRVFITGLSAGGAMAANLLAGRPDLFAAGAVVAGLPAGSARNVISAMTRMSGRGADHDAADWAARARALAPADFQGTWPRLSIWHGQDDNVVAPQNGAELALQFATLQGLSNADTTPQGKTGNKLTLWGPADAPAIELHSLAGGGHVYPPHAAEAIAQFFGIIPR